MTVEKQSLPAVCRLVGFPLHTGVIHHDNEGPYILSFDTLLLHSVPLQLQVMVRQLFDHEACGTSNRQEHESQFLSFILTTVAHTQAFRGGKKSELHQEMSCGSQMKKVNFVFA